jgi:hypothetical protein
MPSQSNSEWGGRSKKNFIWLFSNHDQKTLLLNLHSDFGWGDVSSWCFLELNFSWHLSLIHGGGPGVSRWGPQVTARWSSRRGFQQWGGRVCPCPLSIILGPTAAIPSLCRGWTSSVEFTLSSSNEYFPCPWLCHCESVGCYMDLLWSPPFLSSSANL